MADLKKELDESGELPPDAEQKPKIYGVELPPDLALLQQQAFLPD